jgi:RNA polymerase-binding transcription factor
MGKSERTLKAVKKAAPKAAPKAVMNGRKSDRIRLVAKTVAETKARVAKVVKKANAKNGRQTHIKNGRQTNIVLPDGYRPTESEPFMNAHQRIYFRNKLVAWKEEIVRQNRETLQVLHEDSAQHADLADRATSETDRALELRARDRQRKLIAKIDAALARVEDGSYGYCEETGEPIGLKRLDARPIATLSLEAQERHERREKVFRED